MKTSEKKIRQFRKKRIIPSLIIFLIVVMLLHVLELLIIMLSFDNAVGIHLRECINEANSFASRIEDLMEQGNEIEKASFVFDSEKANIVILDRYDHIIYNNHASIEFNPDNYSSIKYGSKQSRLDVLSTIKLFLEYVESKQDDGKFFTDFQNTFNNMWYESSPFWENEYRVCASFPNSNMNNTNTYNVIYIAAISVLVIEIIVIIVFMYVLMAVIRFNHMVGALYFDEKTVGSNWLAFKFKGDKFVKNKSYRYAVISLENTKYDSICVCFGGDAGDALLKKMYDNLRICLSKKEIVSRHTKSAFGIIIRCKNEEEIHQHVNFIVSRMENALPNSRFHVGVYIVPKDGNVEDDDADKWSSNVEHFYHHASIAAGHIKDTDATKIVYFDEKILDEHIWEHKVESNMEQALKDEEFSVYIQPKYDPRTNMLKGAEALVRWINEKDGFISPGKFIPIFEKNGFITKLDDYMIEHVAKYQAEWIKEGYDIVPVSVNVSRAHFSTENLAEHICELVDKYEVSHDSIEIEITESAFFDDKVVLLETIDKMQKFGFHVSMDDFGTGYSSLNSLKDLPLNVLKLDAEFFRGQEGERADIVIEKAIELAKSLNMETVAEGIEKKEQVDFLAGIGCDMIQGFYFAKPMPVEEYIKKMNRK